MASKSSLFSIVIFFVSIFVTSLSFSTVQAQVTCQSIFIKTSRYASALEPFKQFDKVAGRLIDVLASNPEKVSPEVLRLANAEVEKAAEDYFAAAGIEFTPIPSALIISGLKNWVGLYPFMHTVYQLKGTKNGDETSRLFYGVQANEKFAEHPLTVHFDIYYSLKQRPGVLGQLDKDGTTIHFGLYSLSGLFLGTSTTIRHEIQHYLEGRKILNGEMSLARLLLHSPNQPDSGDYATNLRVDEMESWLRDLRSLTSQQHNQANNAKSLAAVPEDGHKRSLKILNKTRMSEAQATLSGLEEFIDISSKTLRVLADSKNYNSIGRGIDGDAVYISVYPGNLSHERIQIELTGLISPQDAHDHVKLWAAISEVVTWSQERTHQIEKEVASIKKKQAKPKRKFWDFLFK